MRFSLRPFVSIIALFSKFRLTTDPHQQPDLLNLLIGFIVTIVGASLTPLCRD